MTKSNAPRDAHRTNDPFIVSQRTRLEVRRREKVIAGCVKVDGLFAPMPA
jgi:hypothetical protein